MIGAIDFDRQPSVLDDHLGPTPEVNLDWKAYFEEFCKQHGDPVTYGGRLLFPDGWSYAASDYKGPEWRPEKDKKLRAAHHRAYWATRRSMILEEKHHLEEMLDSLRKSQTTKSALLQQFAVALVYDTEGAITGQKQTSGPINYELLEERLNWLNRDLKICDEELSKMPSQLKMSPHG